MSNVPEGAQISDDGRWWWDGNDWQEIVDDADQDAPPDDGIDSEDEGEPAFDFDVGGLRVSPEDSPVESAGEPLKVAFGICNVGTAGGVATMTLYVDGQDTEVVWESEWIEAGFCSAPGGDGYVHDVPGQSEGEHVFEAWFDPPGPNDGYAKNTIDVGPPED